jgi:WD40 repeat protein
LGGLAFSPDGTLLAAIGGDGTVQLLDPTTHRTVGAPFRASPESPAHNLAFSPDGTLLATADTAGYVRLWNPATRQPLGAPFLAVTNGGVISMAFSPDGKLLATADGDGTVRLWGWRSTRTARCWPASTRTATCGCGTRPPAAPPALPSRLTLPAA